MLFMSHQTTLPDNAMISFLSGKKGHVVDQSKAGSRALLMYHTAQHDIRKLAHEAYLLLPKK